MQVRIIALTLKGEDALNKYIQSSSDIELAMSKLSNFNPRRIKFNFEQSQAKKFVTEESFDNPLMIVATINEKYNSQACAFIPNLEQAFHKIMSKSNCGKQDYIVEVL
jgi:CRISPR/Cas system-associated endonuclease Cas3-HD